MTTKLVQVQKLIRHEESARLLGSIAEADAFAAKIKRIVADHCLEPWAISASQQAVGNKTNALSVDAGDAGLPSRKTRQEWTERLAFACASAFHCELLVRTGSNTVIFQGREADQCAARLLYTTLAKNAVSACHVEFSLLKAGRSSVQHKGVQLTGGSPAFARRWKDSFLLGFSISVCQKFICGQHCFGRCRHSSALARTGPKPAAGSERVTNSRPIGGASVLYDALYRGQAQAVVSLRELEAKIAA